MGIPGNPGYTAGASKKAAKNKALNLATQRIGAQRADQLAQRAQTNSVFQKFLDEDERRRRLLGGGGGGSRQPYVPFSFLQLNYTADKLRATLLSLLNKVNSSPAAADLSKPIASLPILEQVPKLFAGIRNQFINFTAAIFRMPLNAMKLAKGLATNFANLATTAMSALVNMRFFKFILGKDEDKDLNPDNDIEEEDIGILGRIKILLLNKKNEHDDDNKRSLLSHIENMADQIVGIFKK